jgi:MinD superfamily P-loop ATPase
VKQIVVISGKGGTGKTVITGAFAALARNKVMADCDVDAADLHLLLKPEVKERHEFKSGKSAFIDKKLCVKCGKCLSICRFSAITEDFEIDPVSCEGCGFCSHICPVGAITMKENTAGEWFVSETRFGAMVHAKLGIAEENSGKLVSMVRKKAKEKAEELDSDFVIVDGAPGIGCPVIASISGVDCALVVTEPTLSGLHDADRVIRAVRHFGITARLAINKYDLNRDMADKIEKYCIDNKIDILGKISFDKEIVSSMVNGKTVIEYSSGKAKKEITDIWNKLSASL